MFSFIKYFDTELINGYFSTQLRIEKVTTKLHYKIQLYRRFIGCIQLKYSDILPDSQKLLTITSMLDGIEKTLSKKRKKRRERVMKPSRNMYRETIEVLENWRIINHDTELSFINDFRINGRISQPDYEFMRNFHIDYKTFKCTKSRNHHSHENFGS